MSIFFTNLPGAGKGMIGGLGDVVEEVTAGLGVAGLTDGKVQTNAPHNTIPDTVETALRLLLREVFMCLLLSESPVRSGMAFTLPACR